MFDILKDKEIETIKTDNPGKLAVENLLIIFKDGTSLNIYALNDGSLNLTYLAKKTTKILERAFDND